MTWILIRIRIRIHFFERRIQDPDPHQNAMDPKHCQPANSEVGTFV